MASLANCRPCGASNLQRTRVASSFVQVRPHNLVLRRGRTLASAAPEEKEAQKLDAPAQESSSSAPEGVKLTTWSYGKTVSDKDLPAWYLAFMLVPFFFIMALPFIPKEVLSF